MNELFSSLTVPSLAYANDLKIFLEVNSISDCLILKNNLNRISSWCVNNCLQLNFDIKLCFNEHKRYLVFSAYRSLEFVIRDSRNHSQIHSILVAVFRILSLGIGIGFRYLIFQV